MSNLGLLGKNSNVLSKNFRILDSGNQSKSIKIRDKSQSEVSGKHTDSVPRTFQGYNLFFLLVSHHR